MKRLEIWVDYDAELEQETRRKVEDVLDRLKVSYTILPDPMEIVRKGSHR